MLVSSSMVYFFVGPIGIILALITTLIESIKNPLDDNITIPIVGIILFKLIF